MAKSNTVEGRACASATEVALEGATPAKRQLLFPMGETVALDGRRFVLRDRAHAEQVIAATRATHRSTELMMDYDHQAERLDRLRSEEIEGQAVASGWIKPATLEVDDAGIWGMVEWTAAASQRIASREYRYVSPWFGFDKATGALTRIFNAGLVNRPAFEILAVAAQTEGVFAVDLSKIAEALGLGADATVEDILAAIAKLKDATAGGEMTAIAAALGLPATATAEAIATAAAQAKASRADPTAFVPMSEFEALKAKVGTLQEDRATAAVDGAIQAGKLTPAGRNWGLDLFRENEAKWNDFVGFAPELVAEGQAVASRIDPKSDTLVAEEKSLAAQLGVDDGAFLASRKEMAQ